MRQSEKGFTFVELMIAVTITVIVAGAASAVIFQIFRNTERNNDHITAVRRVQDAGFWISRDAQMAQSMTTDGLTLPEF